MAILPTTNISTTLVANALGENSHSVGNLCVSPKINMYSKYKPVRFSKESTNGYPNWWKSDYNDTPAGLRIPNSRTPKVAAGYTWEYERPRGNSIPSGGAIEPFRLADFRGYDHNSRPVLWHTNNSITIDVAKEDIVFFVADVNINPNGNSLGISDFAGLYPDLPNCYFAAYVEGSSFDEPFVVTAKSPLTNPTSGVEIEVQFTKMGVWTVWFCISNMQIKQSEYWAAKSAYFFPLCPNINYPNPITVTANKSQVPLGFIDVQEIASGYTMSAAVFSPISNYISGNAQNMHFKTTANVILKCNITNDSNDSNTLYIDTDIKVDFQDWEGNFKQVERVLLYNSNKQNVSSITVFAGQTQEIYLFCYDAIVPTGATSTPSWGQQWISMLEVAVGSNDGWMVTYGQSLNIEYGS